MIYVEVETARLKYNEACRIYDDLIAEKERLYAMTQPGAVVFDKERVSGGAQKNVFEEYVIKKDELKLDFRISEARDILMERKKLYEVMLEELRRSKDVYDRIYRYRIIERQKIYRVAMNVGYSESQTKRILKKIYRFLKDDTK